MGRIEREKITVRHMIMLYCRRKHRTGGLCGDCRGLLEYAEARLDMCPFGERKSACKKCRVHCYAADYRERIREIMRYAGPRMILYHPLIALRHLFGK